MGWVLLCDEPAMTPLRTRTRSSVRPSWTIHRSIDRTNQGFWTNIKDKVYEKRDADGFRCEILCAECDGSVRPSALTVATSRACASTPLVGFRLLFLFLNCAVLRLCLYCNRHLGHVFRNEGFQNPPPNERHCVNGVSIAFVPEGKDVKEAVLPGYDGPVYG